MTAWIEEDFTAANGTALSTLDFIGVGAFNVNNATVQSNRAVASAANQIGAKTDTPPSDDYQVICRVVSTTAGHSHTGCFVRQSGSNLYSVTIDANQLKIYKNFGAAIYAEVPFANSNGSAYDIYVDVSGSSTTTLVVKMKRVSDGYWLTSGGSWQASEATVLTQTDSSTPNTTGACGVWINQNAAIDSFYAYTGGFPASTINVDATDAAIFRSPYNWRAVSTALHTNNPGAYLKTTFSGSQIDLLVDTSHQGALSADNYPVVAWSVDGGAIQRSKLTAGQTALSLATGLSSGSHTLTVWLAASWWQSDRWTTPISNLRVTGFRIIDTEDLTLPTLRTGRVLIYGDSNAEGYEAIQAGVDVDYQDATLAFGEFIGSALGAEVGIVGFAGQGYSTSGGGNVPALSTAWDDYSNGQSRLSGGLFSPEPDWIISTHGQNDSAVSDGTLQTAIETLIDAWRTAAPDAKIAICDPMTRTKASVISAAVTAAADVNCKYVAIAASYDTDFFTNNNHLTGLRGHPAYGAEILSGTQVAFAEGGLTESEVIVLSHVLGRPILF